LEVADIIRAAGPEVCARLATLPSQRRALQALLACRTAALGGQVYGCEQCGARHYSYHSCGNRHCPKCHGQQTERWLEQQRARLLPCPYYLMTFTLPAGLRVLARAHHKLVYGLLLQAAAASIQSLCADPRWLGAQPSLLGVLHTWTRAMLYHPHAHFLVSAGGLSADGQQWQAAKQPRFLVPVRAIARLFLAKVRDGLRYAGLLPHVPAAVWCQAWVVHAQPAGRGQAALDYLARYVFRIAITHARLEALENGCVTLRYRDYRTHQIKHVRLSAEEFMQRFLQHVLPKGFPKVRHYGLASGACRKRRAAALTLLQSTPPATGPERRTCPPPACPSAPEPLWPCPRCRTGRLRWLGLLLPAKKIPP
jgi:hypothetical protein